MVYTYSDRVKIALYAVFLIAMVLIVPMKAHADTDYINFTVDSNGGIYFICPDPTNTGTSTITQYNTYLIGSTNTFPTVVSSVDSASNANIVCSTVQGESMEGGWYNNFSGATNDGYYAIVFNVNSLTDPDYTMILKRTNGTWTQETGTTTVLQSPQNIQILSPVYGSTTASTTYTVKIKYRTPFTIDIRPTTTRHYEVIDAITNEVEYVYNHTVPRAGAENIEYSQVITSDTGSKFIRAMYLNEDGSVYSEVDEVFYSVVTNTYQDMTGISTPRDNTNTLTQIECATFDVGCQFQKVLMFLFYPTDTILNDFKTLWKSIEHKKPFGYVTVTIDALKNLNTTGTAIFDLGTIPFMDTIFTPIKTAIGGILWALYAINLYLRRLKTFDI